MKRSERSSVKKVGIPHFLLSRKMTSFHRYFELGEEESASPFLNKRSKSISRNIHLKSSLISVFLLITSFVSSFFPGSLIGALSSIPLAFVFLLSGTPALISALEDLVFRKDVNIDVLMTLSAFAAFAMGHAYEGALLLVLFALSESLEDLVTLKAKSALSSIHEMAPTKACIIKNDSSVFEKSVHDVEIGAHILVRAGEIVPLDGITISGSGSLSSAHLTGESRTVDVRIGEKVASGSRLVQGSIVVLVTTKQADSTVMKIVRLITEAENTKPKFTQAFERFGRIYSLSVILITFLVLILLPTIFHISIHGPDGALVRAVSFLITASPCALFIAVPIAYLSALSASVKRGAILKGGNIFDRLNTCTTVAFDKTGTLTRGSFRFLKFFPLVQHGNVAQEITTESDVISIAASVEQHVVHPIAQAIVDYAKSQNLPFFQVNSVHVYAGVGVSADVVVAEKISYKVDIHAPTKQDEAIIEKYFFEQSQPIPQGSLVIVSISKNQSSDMEAYALYLLTFEDTLREESVETVRELGALGKHVTMLSGDHALVASRVATELGIQDWKADLKPEDKLKIIIHLSKNRNQGLVMVGDGMNDAPALARANVGISMGKLSSASARDASDIVLLEDNLKLIPWLFHKSKHTRSIVIQNLVVACAAICIGTCASLYGVIPLWAAVIVHEGSTLLVGLNALRLLKR